MRFGKQIIGPGHVIYIFWVEFPPFGFLAVPQSPHNLIVDSENLIRGEMEFHPQPWSLPVPDAGVGLR